MSGPEPKVLVLTMYSGEAEYEKCCEALRMQDYRCWEQRVFENLPNEEAHRQVYQTVMSEVATFDLFLKLDADMVLADSRVLTDLVGMFEDRPQLDHLVVAVEDWMTNSNIIGAHVFSNRVAWREHSETLYVDPDPEYAGGKLTILNPGRKLILHACDPSPLQAFHFGAHRGLQAAQPYRSLGDFRPHNARVQWVYLDRVWRHFESTGDRRLGLAIAAADLVFRRRLPATSNQYGDHELRSAFAAHEHIETAELSEELRPRWGTAPRRWSTWIGSLGGMKVGWVALRSVRDAAAFSVRTIFGKRNQADEPAAKI